MKVHKHKFSSNLRLLTIPMPTLTSATVSVWVNVGSRYEEDGVSGISHFLEHMVFKGGKKYTSAKAISEAVDAMGAEFNAGTSKDWTNFYIKAQTGFLDKAFDVLSDMVLFPKLDYKDIERERGVIIEEMNMYEDTPIYRIGDIFDQLFFEGNTLGRDIIGSKETVGKLISRENFLDFRKTYYHADNILITVAGGVTERQAISLTEKYFGDLDGKTKVSESLEKFKIEQFKPRVKLISKKIEQSHMILGVSGFSLGHKNRYVEGVLTTILGGGMSSRLFTEVREKRGLCYTVRTNSDHFVDTGTISTYTGTDPKKATEAIKVILDEKRKLSLKVSKISKEELQKAKDYEKGHIALSLENTKAVGSYFGYEELLINKITSLEDDFKGIESVTAEEVYTLAKEVFVPERLNLAIIGPFDDTKEFEKVLQSN